MKKNNVIRRLAIVAVALMMVAIAVAPAAAFIDLGTNKGIFVNVSNDAGVRFDLDGATYGGPDNTYYMKFGGGGLNALHITNLTTLPYGDVYDTNASSGYFYVSDTGGRGFDDDIVLMFATTNTTLSEDFSLEIESSGYQWPFTYNAALPLPNSYQFNSSALDESFNRSDLIYGLNTWKPSSVSDYPIFYGEDVYDDANECAIMFIDLNVGALGVNSSLSSGSMARVNYTLNNFDGFCAFNAYAWCNWSNQGQGISWTNRVVDAGSSGYTVSL